MSLNTDSRSSSADTLDTSCTMSSITTDSTINLAGSLSKKYLFRTVVNIEPLVSILEKVSVRIDDNKWFQFDNSAFRKMVFQNIHQPFLDVVKEYYYPAKWRQYGNKELTYNSFTTILRQLCNEVGRTFYTKHVYDHSICNTVYFISASPRKKTISEDMIDDEVLLVDFRPIMSTASFLSDVSSPTDFTRCTSLCESVYTLDGMSTPFL